MEVPFGAWGLSSLLSFYLPSSSGQQLFTFGGTLAPNTKSIASSFPLAEPDCTQGPPSSPGLTAMAATPAPCRPGAKPDWSRLISFPGISLQVGQWDVTKRACAGSGEGGHWGHLFVLHACLGRCEALSAVHLEIREEPAGDRPMWGGRQRKVERAWVPEYSAEPPNQLQSHLASHLALFERINFPLHEAILR